MDTLETSDARLEMQEEWCKDLKFLKVVSSLVVSALSGRQHRD